MLKGIKIRLYPNQAQEQTLNSLLCSYRFVYNQCLSFKKQRYESEKLNTNLSDLGHHFHQTLRDEYECLKEHNTKVLKQSILNMEVAYKNFFKQGKGFPKFNMNVMQNDFIELKEYNNLPDGLLKLYKDKCYK